MSTLPTYPAYKPTSIPWLQQVPEHWGLARAKTLFEKVERLVGPEDETVTCFRDGTVTLRKNRRATGYTESLKEIGYQGIRKGDLVIHIMDAFAGSIGVSDSDGKSTPVYSVCVPRDNSVPWYYAYQLRQMARAGWLQALSKGIRERSSDFRYELFGVQTMLVPPPAEQHLIVRYLQHVDAKVKRYLRAKRKLIAALQEQKQAIIQRAVTRGLDLKVKLKPSGVEWLGEVPEHWEVRRLKSLVLESVAGPYGSSLTKAMYVSQGFRVYGQQQVIPDDFRVGDYFISEEKFRSMQRYRVFPGDILVSVMGTVGRVAVVPEDVAPGIINPRLVRYRPDTRAVRARYLQLTMQAPSSRGQLTEVAKGTTMEGLNMGMLGRLLLLVPPVDEQDLILSFIANETATLNAAMNQAEEEIALMHEYHTRLIADVVTGAVDVTAVAKAMAVDAEDQSMEEEPLSMAAEGEEDYGEAENES